MCIKIYYLALNNMKHPQTSFRRFIRNVNMSSVLLIYKTKHSPYKGLAFATVIMHPVFGVPEPSSAQHTRQLYPPQVPRVLPGEIPCSRIAERTSASAIKIPKSSIGKCHPLLHVKANHSLLKSIPFPQSSLIRTLASTVGPLAGSILEAAVGMEC